MIGRSGERGSGMSVLAARHDDDDDDDAHITNIIIIIEITIMIIAKFQNTIK